jgi:hypothetical protein
MSTIEPSKYLVYVDDNFHYMDESHRYMTGVYDDCQTAIEKCKEIVDGYLLSEYRQGISAQELLDKYKSFGDDPWISSSDETCRFSAWSYAAQRCRKLCGGNYSG